MNYNRAYVAMHHVSTTYSDANSPHLMAEGDDVRSSHHQVSEREDGGVPNLQQDQDILL